MPQWRGLSALSTMGHTRDYFFNLYPYYGYPASFGLFPQPLASPEVTSDATAAMRTGA